MDDISYALERERVLRERIAALTRERDERDAQLDAAHAQLREADAVIEKMARHNLTCWDCGDAADAWRDATKDAAWREEGE